MDASTEKLAALLDREKIRDCIAASLAARTVVTRRSSVSHSGRTRRSISACSPGSFDEYLAWVVPGSPAIPVTQHMLGQTVIECSGAPPWLKPT